MLKKEYRTIFHNPNKKEDVERLWIRLLTETYTPQIKEIIGFSKKKGEGLKGR